MAYYCRDCEMVMDSPVSACPQCGEEIIHDDSTIESLTNIGYRLWHKPVRRSSARTNTNTRNSASTTQAPTPTASSSRANPVRIDDSHIMDSLHRAYEEQYTTYHSSSNGVTNNSAVNPQAPDTQSGEPFLNDFFSQFTNEPETPTTAPEESADTNQGDNQPQFVNIPTYQDNPHQGSTPSFSDRTRNTAENMRRVPWRRVWRILCIVFAVIAVMYIWAMRSVIISSIWNFVTSLIPIAVVVIIVVWIFRRLLR